MLIFGGLVKRELNYDLNIDEETTKTFDIYNYCEDYQRLLSETLPYEYRTCGE